MQSVYLNPLTDFGFKKLFGEEPHKDLLISFLNTLLPERHQIAELQYTKKLTQLTALRQSLLSQAFYTENMI